MATEWQSWDLNPGPLPLKPMLLPAPGAQKVCLPWESAAFCIYTDCCSFDGKGMRFPGASISLLMIWAVFLNILAQPGSKPPS